MDWAAFVDIYCERTSPAFWAEPLNAVTNLAFLAAAYAAWRSVQQRHAGAVLRKVWDLRTLCAMLVLIGLCSFAFHTFARRWAGLLDVLAIALYLHCWVAVFLARRASWPWRWAWLGVPGFALFSWGFAWALRELLPGVRGVGQYTPALAALLLLAAWCAAQRDAAWRWLLAAAAVFSISLTLRQLDMPLCSQWRYGTHFLWHCLNALTLWLSMRALLTRSRMAPAH
jgi:hypothetical protein